MEAPTLGKGNVLVNINNKSKEYFDHILTDNRVTRFANSATDFINELEKGDFPNALEIKKSNNRVMVSGFEANLQSALQEMHIL